MVAPTIICENLIPIPQMELQRVNIRDLPVTKKEMMEWCAQRGLIKNSVFCHACGIFMSLNVYSSGVDGFRWKCNRCSTRKSIRDESFFASSKLSLLKCLSILYYWSRDLPQQDIAHEVGLGRNSTHTIVDWCSFCREICEQDLVLNPQVIGGFNEETLEPIVVEIDESKFFHRKYHRGRWIDGRWVFGGVERDTGNCFLVEVPNRTLQTLHEMIQRYILPGTHIISDGWRAYQGISEIRDGVYTHERIIHEENFVDPNDEFIHTQNIENLWMRAKRKLRRQFGTSEALFTSYMHEFVWRNKWKVHKDFLFVKFLKCLRTQYNLEQ